MESKGFYEFGEFRLCPSTERLWKGDEALKIEPQLYSLLLLFVKQPGVVVTRDTIERIVWAGRPVSDEAIRAALKKLRDVLADDARSPRFIKTIPKQGYKWLAPVSENLDTGKQDIINKPVVWTIIAICIACVTSLFLVTSFSVEKTYDSDKTASPVVNRLTQLTGSEVNADYNAAQNKLAFLHRDSRSSPQQLYIKTLNDGVVTRLSWDNANYSDSRWCPKGEKLAFTRLDEQGYSFHIAHFLPDGEVSRVENIDSELLQNKFVVGWLADDKGLLLAEKLTQGQQHSIYAFTFSDNRLQALTSPNVAGRGDYNAALSFNGEMLAVLREEVAKEASLIITSLVSGDMVAKTRLPFVPSRLAWHENTSVAMTNFYGEHVRFNLSTQSLNEAPVLPDNSLDIFSTCGEQCYVLRQHNGNFLDLQEQPMSSLLKSVPKSEQTPLLQQGRLIRRAGAQDFPQYFSQGNGLLFVSLHGKRLLFQRTSTSNIIESIASLDATNPISAIALSPDSTRFVGISNGRIFTSSLNNDSADVEHSVNFITSAMERYENPVWDSDSQHLFVTRISGNVPSIVRLNIDTLESSHVVDGLIAFTLEPDTTDMAYGILSTLSLVELHRQDGQWVRGQTMGQVAAASPNRWKIANNIFYYTKHVMPEAFMCAIPLGKVQAATEEVCWSIGDNRFRLHFDIDFHRQKVMLVESLSAESDVIKLTW
ncbi:winged helix-turn-helix domain-containing protein [Alteromonas sp. KUL49]|uniref:winged helix-turn-helix domain-containing protein n=1 Tax=Alteromonas sp. KUL49 TaxID=2480798 RepID=UPI00102EE56E|nr:winged helix-turn-helix domain-containing protein [Alteromonas sp. KUL49]TAP35532.1 hypothetical protein EYS00_18640 [Alteromonas sp. KUL49]GEA13413.1 hypothetical protein KUL49_37880 [Alteromonas sp. KUL49]